MKKINELSEFMKNSIDFLKNKTFKSFLNKSIEEGNLDKVIYYIEDLKINPESKIINTFKSKRESYPNESGNFDMIKTPNGKAVIEKDSPIFIAIENNRIQILYYLLEKIELNKIEIKNIFDIKYNVVSFENMSLEILSNVIKNSTENNKTEILYQILTTNGINDLFIESSNENSNERKNSLINITQERFVKIFNTKININKEEIIKLIKITDDKSKREPEIEKIIKEYLLEKTLIKNKEIKEHNELTSKILDSLKNNIELS